MVSSRHLSFAISYAISVLGEGFLCSALCGKKHSQELVLSG